MFSLEFCSSQQRNCGEVPANTRALRRLLYNWVSQAIGVLYNTVHLYTCTQGDRQSSLLQQFLIEWCWCLFVFPWHRAPCREQITTKFKLKATDLVSCILISSALVHKKKLTKTGLDDGWLIFKKELRSDTLEGNSWHVLIMSRASPVLAPNILLAAIKSVPWCELPLSFRHLSADIGHCAAQHCLEYLTELTWLTSDLDPSRCLHLSWSLSLLPGHTVLAGPDQLILSFHLANYSTVHLIETHGIWDGVRPSYHHVTMSPCHHVTSLFQGWQTTGHSRPPMQGLMINYGAETFLSL